MNQDMRSVAVLGLLLLLLFVICCFRELYVLCQLLCVMLLMLVSCLLIDEVICGLVEGVDVRLYHCVI